VVYNRLALAPYHPVANAEELNMPGLTQDQVTSAIRWVVTSMSAALSGFLVSKGLATAASAAALMTFLLGMIPGIVALFWGIWAHSASSTIASASALPEVQSVVTSPSVAHSAKFVANDKVITYSESQTKVNMATNK